MFEETKKTFDLRHRLEQGNAGDELSAAEIEAITGISDLKAQQQHFYSVAKKVHAYNYDIIWRWSRAKKCYCCLNEEEKIPFMKTRIRRARNQSIVARRTVEGTDVSKLSNEQKTQLSIAGTIAHLIERSTEGRTQHILEKEVSRLTLPDHMAIVQICKSRIPK